MTRSIVSKRRRRRMRGKSAPIGPQVIRRTGFLTGQILVPEDFDRMGAATIEDDFAEVFKESRDAVDPLRAARARAVQQRAALLRAIDAGMLEGLETTLAALGVSDPLMQMQFFLTVDPDLEQRPLDALRDGKVEAVMQAARRYGRFGDDSDEHPPRKDLRQA